MIYPLGMAAALALVACGREGPDSPGPDPGLADDTGTTTDGGTSADGGDGADDTGPSDGGTHTEPLPDADGDGSPDSDDCAPEDPTIHPDADELCNGIDDDCDGGVDDADPEGVTDGDWWYPDADEDGFGDIDGAVFVCVQPEGSLDSGGDCDDSLADVSPAAVELCGDVVDNDCDGTINGCRVDGVFLDDELSAATWEAGLSSVGTPGAVWAVSGVPVMDGLHRSGIAVAHNGDSCYGRVDLVRQDAFGGPLAEAASDWVHIDSLDSGSPQCGNLIEAIHTTTDLDGDGYTDLLIGAPGQDVYDSLGLKAESEPGYVYAVPGPVIGGFDAWLDSAWVRGTSEYEGLGTDLAAVPDLDGDGFIDLTIALQSAGGSGGDTAVMLFAGPVLEGVDREAPLATWLGDGTASFVDTEPAGDLDADGAPDIAFGDPHDSFVFVLDTTLRGVQLLEDASVVIGDSPHRGGQMGWAIAGEVDIDADGYDDLVVGAPTTDASTSYRGQVAIFRGPLFGEYSHSEADILIAGTEAWGTLGWAVHAANLDGLGGDDIVLGQPCYDSRCETGVSQVVVFYAPEDGSYTQSDADLTIQGRSSFLGTGPLLDSIAVDGVTHLLLGAFQGHNQAELDPGRPGGDLAGTVDLIPLPGW